MSDEESLIELLLDLQSAIVSAVVAQCEAQSESLLSAVAADDEGDTIYAIDRVSEELLTERLEARAESIGGLVLIAEGLASGRLEMGTRSDAPAAWRFIVDPIDGTRGIMYQKRSAWVLSGVAPNRGEQTRLSDVVVAAQSEIPTLKQHLVDRAWAIRGRGAVFERRNRLAGGPWERLQRSPSRSASIEHGYATVARFFPGARDELAAIDEEVTLEVLGPSPAGKALCFEDQYASTGGQLYELMVGHDRFVADLRPLMQALLRARGQVMGLCCHPYDLCTALVAREAGVVLTDAHGGELDAPLDVEADVAWVGYANREIHRQVAPALARALARRGLSG